MWLGNLSEGSREPLLRPLDTPLLSFFLSPPYIHYLHVRSQNATSVYPYSSIEDRSKNNAGYVMHNADPHQPLSATLTFLVQGTKFAITYWLPRSINAPSRTLALTTGRLIDTPNYTQAA